MKLAGTVGVIFDATSPYGTHLTRTMRDQDVTVVAASPDPDALAALAAETSAIPVVADVASDSDVAAVLGKARAQGRLYLCVGAAEARHDAGRLLAGDGTATSLDVLTGPLFQELRGALNILRHAGQAFAAQAAEDPGGRRPDRGLIILTTAARPFEGHMGQVGYGAAKSGVLGMVLPAARELVRWGVRVCAAVTPPGPPDQLTLDRYGVAVHRIANEPQLSGEAVQVAAESVPHQNPAPQSAPEPAGAVPATTYPTWSRVVERRAAGEPFRLAQLDPDLRRLLLSPKLAAETYRDAAVARGFDDFAEWLDRLPPLPPSLADDDWLTIKTATQLYWARTVDAAMESGLRGRVVEVGGGVGNLARLALHLFDVEEYMLIDIPGVLDLQREFLGTVLPAALLRRVSFVDAHQLVSDGSLPGEFDLGVSTFALTETPPQMRAWYLREVFSSCRQLYLVGQRTFQQADVLRQLEPLVAEHFDYRVEPYLEEAVLGRPSFELTGRRR